MMTELREQRPGGARILCDIGRLQQLRDDDDAARAGSDDFGEVVELDAADAEDGERELGVDCADVRQADWCVVRLSGRGEERAEADVIRAFGGGLSRLREAVG